jgi:hypothetical protein
VKSSLPAPTKSEQRRFEIIKREVGCIACYMDYGVLGTWADAHHLIDPKTGNRISHSHTIPLCPDRHHKYGKRSIHKGKLRFHEDYGTDESLLSLTNSKVVMFEANTVGAAR